MRRVPSMLSICRDGNIARTPTLKKKLGDTASKRVPLAEVAGRGGGGGFCFFEVWLHTVAKPSFLHLHRIRYKRAGSTLYAHVPPAAAMFIGHTAAKSSRTAGLTAQPGAQEARVAEKWHSTLASRAFTLPVTRDVAAESVVSLSLPPGAIKGLPGVR